MSESEETDSQRPAKIARIEGDVPFHRMKHITVLNEAKDRKVVFLRGKVDPGEKDAVAILEKKPFNTSPANLESLFSSTTKLECDISNDIYSTYAAIPAPQHAAFKATFIYPATQKHIDKYRKQDVEVLEETADDYRNVTLPYLKEENKFSTQWVINILEKKTESERIVYEDPDPENGFILLPDMKWDTNDVDSLYLIAITHKHGIKSLRDITSDHLPLLRNIMKKGEEAIFNKYGLPKEKLRVYIHYQPSYYHFHVHFTHIGFDAPGTTVTRAHLLSDVIENVELMGDYYQKKTMTFVGRKDDKLTLALRHKREEVN